MLRWQRSGCRRLNGGITELCGRRVFFVVCASFVIRSLFLGTPPDVDALGP